VTPPFLPRLNLPVREAQLPDGVRRAAVALVFGPEEDLLFIRRAERKGDLWSGHIAFPGGREDADDSSLRATAVREVREELGLDLQDARCLGALPPQASPRNAGPQQVNVIPWVFQLSRWPALAPNHEVAAVLRVPLATLVARESRAEFPYDWLGAVYDLPCVNLPEGRLWGMTLRMVDDLLEHLEGTPTGQPWRPNGTD
jgi:8-oxo-dGTP pyrophosphatase MutT (NUDIX family)